MARSRESAIKKAMHALALAHDQEGKPEGQAAQIRADAIIAEYSILPEELRGIERRKVFWRAVTLYPGFNGGPAPWQLAAASWAAARYGGGSGLVGDRPCVLAYQDGALDKMVIALRTASEALLAVYGQAQQSFRATGPFAARGMSSANLPQDTVGWIFMCLLAGHDEPAPPPAPTPAPPAPDRAEAPAYPVYSDPSRSSKALPTAPSTAPPTTALSAPLPPWARGARPDACEDIPAPEVPMQIPGALLDMLMTSVARVLDRVPARS